MYQKANRGSARRLRVTGAAAQLSMAFLLMFAVFMQTPVALAVESETADTLLDLERKIEIQKRIMELRALQIKRQEQDMRLFKGSSGAAPAGQGPQVVRIPEIRLAMIRSYKKRMVAGLYYGDRYMVVKKGDFLDEGVKVLNVDAMGVLIDVHGSKQRFGLNHLPTHSDAKGNTQ